jgi:hypothetical protein
MGDIEIRDGTLLDSLPEVETGYFEHSGGWPGMAADAADIGFYGAQR